MHARTICRKVDLKARRLFGGAEQAKAGEDVVALDIDVDEAL